MSHRARSEKVDLLFGLYVGVLSGSWDKTLCAWGASGSRELRRFEGHTDIVTGCASFVSSLPFRAVLFALAWALGVVLASPAFAADSDQFSYQVPFPESSHTFEEADLRFDQRAEGVLAAMACGSEIDYALHQFDAGEDSSAYLIAKLAWATGYLNRDTRRPRIAKDCMFTRYFSPSQLCEAFDAPGCTEASFDSTKIDFGAQFMGKYFPWDECKSSAVVISRHLVEQPSFLFPPPPQPAASRYGDAVRGDFSITPACLLKQVDMSLERMTVNAQMGTDGLGCHDPLATAGVTIFTDPVKGDWDVVVRNLTRVAFIDKQNLLLRGSHALGTEALANLQEHLLSAEGPPAEEAYPITGCGNTTEGSGTSQERADDRDWTDEPFWQTVGDILLFFLALFFIVLIAFVIGWLLFTALGVGAAIGAGVVVAIVAVVIPVLLFVDAIDETENHLLMINTSAYLKNQMIIEDVPTSSGADRYRKDNAELKEWMLTKMQSVMKNEFIEYNSRPYSRYSILALQNIADYANDDDLRTGAKLVLEYSFAKFAVGSQQGRRFLPFRRKREAMRKCIDFDSKESNGLFDLICAGDQQIALGLMYAGQTDQVRDNFVSFGAASLGLFAATSSYRPDNQLIDLALNKERGMYQRIHYDKTAEVYSSGVNFLVSAGGVTTDYAYTFLGKGKADDKGIAVPTTLFIGKSPLDDFQDLAKPWKSLNRTTLGELIRIDGARPEDPTADSDSYDDNLCVWYGFACGTNLVIPPTEAPANGSAYDGSGFSDSLTLPGKPGPCRITHARGTTEKWDFIDSTRCMAYQHAPRVFVVTYRQDCPGFPSACEDNVGFFEVIDAGEAEDFDAFQQKVMNDNPSGFLKAGWSGLVTGAKGTYKSAHGQTIEFETLGRNSGILAVDGVAQADPDAWPLAEGSPLLALTRSPITSSGDGLVTIINNPTFAGTLELDFRDKDKPVRRLK